MSHTKKYSRFEIDKVKAADIRLFIPGCNRGKASQEIECPECHKKKFSVVHKGGKNFARCFACEFCLSDPIAAYGYFKGLDLSTEYLKCVEGAASDANITLIPEDAVRTETVKKAKEQIRLSFCGKQLEASGVSVEDVMATVVEDNNEFLFAPFQPGSVGPGFSLDRKGDDMLIYYFDLYGRPMQYSVKGSRTLRKYVRVRYANPDLHLSQDGSAMKYQTPPGAPAQVYIPEKIRRMYKQKAPIDVLFLQEGEKKAEKACKHGMLSLGLQGIMNIGSKEQGIIQTIFEVVKTCQVRHIVLVMDSDWNDLSRNITVGDRADKRPVSFATAVIKFQQYVKTFHNNGLNVDAWWGHVNVNSHEDKGVDDLLVGSLLNHEDELIKDVDYAMHTHDGRGKWLDIHKITTLSDAKIRDFWNLNDSQAFFDTHKERLMQLNAFKLNGVRYKIENNRLVPISRYSSDVDIYSIEQDSKERDKVVINYVETFKFLSASGFYRLCDKEAPSAGYELIHIEDGIIDRSAAYEVRDFIRRYISTNVKSPLVLEYFFSKLDVLLPDKKLEGLELRTDNFNRFEPDVQRTYYNNGQIQITRDGITSGLPLSDVWRSRIVPRNFKRVEIIKSISKIGGSYSWELTEDGKKCEFLQYLINTSNNYYTHDSYRETTEQENLEWIQHIVNKVTTIGYLLCDFKYATERKAVVVQDHRMSEVGQSYGGVGKSLLGDAISRVTSQVFLDGKTVNLSDEFLLSGVTRATRNIFFDDVRANFDFEKIFTMITAGMVVNPKGQARYTIPVSDSPKILINTNHAINKASEGSFKRRISYVEFSSWYNPEHTPINDFHHMFFDEWTDEQWSLFDNLMAECVMYYLRSLGEGWSAEGQGAVPPPMHNVELRTLRQDMGEIFLSWCEEYFDPSGLNLNERRERRDLWMSFSEYAAGSGMHGVTRSNLRRKLEKYCAFKGYDFNVTKQNKDKMYYSDWKPLHPDEIFYGGDDKSGGKEYITIYSPELEKEKHPF